MSEDQYSLSGPKGVVLASATKCFFPQYNKKLGLSVDKAMLARCFEAGYMSEESSHYGFTLHAGAAYERPNPWLSSYASPQTSQVLLSPLKRYR